jgi:transketolase
LRCGWDRWIGEAGWFVGLTGFWTSDAPEDLLRQFDITAKAVV